jgi:hypothetical protein
MFKMPHGMSMATAQLALDSAMKRVARDDIPKVKVEREHPASRLEGLLIENGLSGEPLEACRRLISLLVDPQEEVEVEEEEAEDEAAEEVEEEDEREEDDRIEMMVDAVVRALGEDTEEVRAMARNEILRRRGDHARDNRPAGSASRVGMRAALAADERRARMERKRRASFERHFPDARRLEQVGVDPHRADSAGGSLDSLLSHFPDAARIGRV